VGYALAQTTCGDSTQPMIALQIDPASPDRRFCFNVRVTDAEAYEVDSIDPPVPGIDFTRSRELNEGNDFSSFVQRMRAASKTSSLKNTPLRRTTSLRRRHMLNAIMQ